MQSNKLPAPLCKVVDELAQLPGVGPKSALRMGLTLLKWPQEKAEGLGESIKQLRRTLCLCEQCASLTDQNPCAICADAARDGSVLCLIPDWDSLLVMEEAGFFRGKYFVLGGLLSPLDGVNPDQLELDRLEKRLAQGEIREVVLALGTTTEAEATESHLKNLLHRKYPDLRVARLAQGIPLGAHLKFMDRETLKQSMQYRQSL